MTKIDITTRYVDGNVQYQYGADAQLQMSGHNRNRITVGEKQHQDVRTLLYDSVAEALKHYMFDGSVITIRKTAIIMSF